MLKHLISLSDFRGKIKIKIEKNRLRPIDADLQIPDIKKFKQITSWKPEYRFEETMQIY